MKKYIISLLLLIPHFAQAAQSATALAAQLRRVPTALKFSALRAALKKTAEKTPAVIKNTKKFCDEFNFPSPACFENVRTIKMIIEPIEKSLLKLKYGVSKQNPSETLNALEKLTTRLVKTRQSKTTETIIKREKELKQSEAYKICDQQLKELKGTKTLAELRLQLLKKKDGPRAKALEKIITDLNSQMTLLGEGSNYLTQLGHRICDLKNAVQINQEERVALYRTFRDLKTTLNNSVALNSSVAITKATQKSAVKTAKSSVEAVQESRFNKILTGLSAFFGFNLGKA